LEIVCVFSNARARHEFLFVSLISFDLPPNAFVITSKAFVGHTLKTCGQISLFSIMRCLGKQRGSDLSLHLTYIRALECNPSRGVGVEEIPTCLIFRLGIGLDLRPLRLTLPFDWIGKR
jgi:hypothetical protein